MSASAVPPSLQGPEKDIVCPACRKPCKYGPSNPWRPFCCSRCRNADFGAWASENYRVAARPDPSDDDDDGIAPPS
jgi:endogenous inhibitor of DNA gyrase (YacG/DUF329 family)